MACSGVTPILNAASLVNSDQVSVKQTTQMHIAPFHSLFYPLHRTQHGAGDKKAHDHGSLCDQPCHWEVSAHSPSPYYCSGGLDLCRVESEPRTIGSCNPYNNPRNYILLLSPPFHSSPTRRKSIQRVSDLLIVYLKQELSDLFRVPCLLVLSLFSKAF